MTVDRVNWPIVYLLRHKYAIDITREAPDNEPAYTYSMTGDTFVHFYWEIPMNTSLAGFKMIRALAGVAALLTATTASAQLCTKIKNGFTNTCVSCDTTTKQAHYQDSVGCFACTSFCRLLRAPAGAEVAAATTLGLDYQLVGNMILVDTALESEKLAPPSAARPLFDAETLVAIAGVNPVAAYVLRGFNPDVNAPYDLAKGVGYVNKAPSLETVRLATAGHPSSAWEHTLQEVPAPNAIKTEWKVTRTSNGKAYGRFVTTLIDAQGAWVADAFPAITLEFTSAPVLRLVSWSSDSTSSKPARTPAQ